MPKTPDETKKGLACCAASIYQCADDCPYRAECRNGQGGKAMNEDALALIQQLQAENAEKDARIRQLEAERDAALKCIKDVCGCMACNSARVSKLDSPCRECICDGMVTYDYWLWRGVQKEESEDGKE